MQNGKYFTTLQKKKMKNKKDDLWKVSKQQRKMGLPDRIKQSKVPQ